MENTGREFIKYQKNVIMLNEEKREFSIGDNVRICGTLKIETGNNKGAMSLSIKNLRFFERSRYIYKLILFGEKKERTIHTVIGTVIVNRTGTAESYFRFNPMNIDGKGNSIREYSDAIVAAVSMKDNKEPLHPVLRGSLYGRTSGSEKTEKECEEKKQEEERKTYNGFYNEHLKSVCGRMEKACETYDSILPFSEDKTKATAWKRISNISSLPVISPGALKCASKYRHYLFGCNERLYLFGIPGRCIKEEHPEEGCSGFVLWQPIRGAECLGADKEECPNDVKLTAYGYWIAAVDRETGDIINPLEYM